MSFKNSTKVFLAVLLLVLLLTPTEGYTNRKFQICLTKCHQDVYDCRHFVKFEKFGMCTQTHKECLNYCKANYGGPRFF